MLIEIRDVRQVPNEELRRWFCDDHLELLVWYKPDGTVHGFQLCYDKKGREKALRWFADRGFSHYGVDTGEESPLANRTPILVADDHFKVAPVLSHFRASDEELPPELREFVRKKLEECGHLDKNRSPFQNE